MEFFDLINYVFIQKAYLAGSFIAVLCAVLGIFLVLKKLSLIGDGLSHVSFGAIALGLFLGIYPFYVAIPIVLLASYFIFKLTESKKIYGDTAIGIISSIGIASGVILASVSSGFNVDLFSYLFGNILAISTFEVYLAVFLSIFVSFIVVFIFKDLFSATFDEEYAKASGVNIKVINLILNTLTALTVILAVKVVGIMLVSALLILPAVSSLQVAKSFKNAFFVSVIFALISVIFGITLSFYLDIPSGATIVLVSFVIFLLSLFFKTK
jgi:zinc transport system permease protein